MTENKPWINGHQRLIVINIFSTLVKKVTMAREPKCDFLNLS